MNNQPNSWSLVGIAGKWSYALLGIDERLVTFRTCVAIMPDIFRLQDNKLYANMDNWHKEQPNSRCIK
jgi:hypothetical protein